MLRIRHRRKLLLASLLFVVLACAIVLRLLPDSTDSSQVALSKTTQISASQRQQKPFRHLARDFLNKYCLECHAGPDSGSGVDLQPLVTNNADVKHADLWQQTFRAIEDQYMPPADYTATPSMTETQELKQAWVNSTRRHASATRPRTTIRRLNRTEFENTLRDLFYLESHPFNDARRILLNDHYYRPSTGRMPDYVMAFSHFQWNHRSPSEFSGVPSLPDDPAVEHGFNNNATSISFSPLQLESFIEVVSKLLNHPEFRSATPLWSAMFQTRSTSSSDQRDDAREVLNAFLPRAFRRPASGEETDRWLALFQNELTRTDSFEAAMKATVTGILVSPGFLFRTDTAERPNGYDDFTIASRLSYFLWNSMPDDELLQAATKGTLQQPDEIRRQVRRMLSDRRSKSLSTSFGVQWLKVAKAISARPERSLFNHYYQDLGHSPPGVSMAIEQMLLFETIMVENRSVLEFIDTDIGYVNRLLADWYGLDTVKLIGYTPDINDLEDFFRITWPDRKRGGIISAGATLVSTSVTDRTSPVYRGAWLLDVVLNRPPPPPPADAPPLQGTPDAKKPVNIRERLEVHRRNPNCASCHDKIDPPGFALEQFDTVGQWRSTYRDGVAVDSTGYWSGRPIDGVIELKQAILSDRTTFARAFIEHLLEYSLGRSLDARDGEMIEYLTGTTGRQDFRFGSIVEEVALQAVHPGHRAKKTPPPRMTSRGLRGDPVGSLR